MPNTKKWKDMTEQDILTLKRQQCCKCYYFSIGNDGKQETNNTKGLCDYLDIEGHSRGCSPLECVEKGRFRPIEERKSRRKAMKLYA